MNQRFDPSENRNVNPAAWPAEQASQRIDPTKPATDPLANQRRPEDIEPRSTRSNWPILIILLAGVVLALLVWLPGEMSTDQTNDAATPPATEQTTTPPADTATPPVDNSATPGTATPETNTTPTTPDTTTTTPDTTTTPNATPATPDTQTPATGTAPQN